MANDPFNRNFDPQTGQSVEIAPGMRRVTAPNASPMTFTGTNTYLLGEREIAVIDPGPDDPAHLAAILAAVGDAAKISHVFVTHSHVDHSPLARRLGQIAGAPVLALGDSYAYRSVRMVELASIAELGGGEGVDVDFAPDIQLTDGEIVQTAEWSLEAIATPGHFSNHMCFHWAAENAAFSGDHVMGWATTLVSPPDGDLTAFMNSLAIMAARNDDRYFPGHGAPVADPSGMVSYQIGHRKSREAQILECLTSGPATPRGLTDRIYTDIPASLIPAAARNVFSHLLDLHARNLVYCRDKLSPNAAFSLRMN
jgi:glyoxylase-like metal-dependent hydrolase (beta-lactamase superfamily II)